MIVNDLDFVWAGFGPHEAHAPLVIDTDAPLACPITLERFKAVALPAFRNMDMNGSSRINCATACGGAGSLRAPDRASLNEARKDLLRPALVSQRLWYLANATLHHAENRRSLLTASAIAEGPGMRLPTYLAVTATLLSLTHSGFAQQAQGDISLSSTVEDQPRLLDPYGMNPSLPNKLRQPLAELKRPWPDVLETLLTAPDGSDFHAPESAWFDAQSKRFSDLLAAGAFDVLVVPFQVQHFGIDRIGRSTMTADLAYALVARGARVADPYLAAQALGDGQRTISPRAVVALADRLRVRTLIFGYAGHDRAGKLAITIQIHRRDEQSGVFNLAVSTQRDWLEVPFSEVHPPEQMFHRLVPEIIRFAGFDAEKVTPRGPNSHDTLSLPVQPHDLVRATNRSASANAVALEVLGALMPERSYRARERLYERALNSVADLPTTDAYGRLAKARALFQLHRRPSALEVLGNDAAPPARALRAILNGNLPDAEQATPEIQDRALRLIATFELADLRQQYGAAPHDDTAPEILTETAALSPAWNVLIERRWKDPDVWSIESNAPIKKLLDESFFLADYTLDALLAGQIAIGKSADLENEIDLAVARHFRRLVTMQAPTWCCLVASPDPSSWDYLWLLEAIGEDTLFRKIRFELDVRKQPNAAIAYLEVYANIYAGQPEFEALHARADYALAEALPAAERAPLVQSSQRHALTALYWEQGQSVPAYSAAISLGVPSPESDPFTAAYVKDVPLRFYWFTTERPGRDGKDWTQSNLAAALADTTSAFAPVAEQLRSLDPGARNDLLASLSGRFSGNPEATTLLPVHGPARHDAGAEVQAYRQAIARAPDVWKNYAELGNLLIERQGNYAEAAKVYASFPGFAGEGSANRVAISNYAYRAGSRLYWQGEFDAAAPFYAIAAINDDGSEASITSRLRLALLEGNYKVAAQGSLERANRYDDAEAYRDYLSLLHLLGYSNAAWAAFGQLADRFANSQVWFAALVGQRMEGMNLQEFKTWITQDSIRGIDPRKRKPAIGYALLWNIVDREPPADLPDLLRQIEGEPRSVIDVDGRTVLSPSVASEGSFSATAPSRFRSMERAKLSPGTKLASGHATFALGYLAMRGGSFRDAVTAFDELAARYRIDADEDELGFALPYFAYASAKAGDPLELERFVDTTPAEEQRFYFHLAKAFFDGLRRDPAAALQHLKRAFNLRPQTGEGPISTEYQFAEACEWLFLETRDESYRELMLDWASKHQRIQPMSSWAYAIEARWSQSPIARARALSFVVFLDRDSLRLKDLPPEEIAAARARVKDTNPFSQL